MNELRDKLAEEYACRIMNTLETADARSRSFKAGFDACLREVDADYIKHKDALEKKVKFWRSECEQGITHTCHDECTRLQCIQAKRIEDLENKIKQMKEF